jgi:DNA-binding NarL/FixJ family response regulator
LVKELRGNNPALGIVVLSMYSGDEYLFGALDNGASAFVSKDAPAEDVMAAARHAVAMPGSFSAPNLAEAMQRRLSPSGPQLTPREREVLNLLADGLGVAEISKELYISQSTTKSHVSKLYEKLGAANRAQALMTALNMGLITSEGRG